MRESVRRARRGHPSCTRGRGRLSRRPAAGGGGPPAGIAELADRTDVPRRWVAPPSARPSGSAAPYAIAVAVGVGILGALGLSRRR